MQAHRLWHKLIIVTLMLCLVSSSFGTLIGGKHANAEENRVDTESDISGLSDVTGHWAETQLLDWLNKGFIKGYQDHTFRPDKVLSRGEFMTLVNRSFGFVEEAPISFDDVASDNWAYSEVAKAVKAEYVTGYVDGTIRTQREVTREEAAVMISRLLKLSGIEQPANPFSDSDSFSAWSKTQIAAVADKKLMIGYKDGSFRPKSTITRAEIVVALARALNYRIAHSADSAGAYGPSTGVQTIEGDYIVDAAGVTLQNMRITGNLLLTANIGEGDVYLKNVNVKGHTEIKGGGENSIHLVDSILSTITINKKNGTVRIVAEGNTVISEALIRTSAILEESKLTDEGFIKVTLEEALPKGASVKLNGNFKTVVIAAAGIALTLSGKVDRMDIPDTATGLQLTMSNESTIVSLIVNALIKVLGQGTIESVSMGEHAKGTSFEKAPISIKGPGAPVSVTPSGPSNPSTGLGTLSVIANGQPNAIIILADDASKKVSLAANTLKEYVYKSTGAQLPVMTETEYSQSAGNTSKNRIYIGKAAPGQETNAASMLNGMLEDGYIILPRQSDISIVGRKDIGTEYGVYEFLERYVGVRWLLPGEFGEDVPHLTDLTVPLTNVKQQPAFWSRMMWPLQYVNEGGNNPTQYEWGVRNRLRIQNIGFDHTLWLMFLPGVYLKDHPDYYPHNSNGDPLIPAYFYGWQPCYSNDATVQVAVDWIDVYFRDHPDASSVSLGVNDNGGFCEAQPNHPKNPHKLNSLGLPDMSDIYYSWVNKVVEKVLKKYPDKWFGLLAYQEVYDPPSFALNERVVPYLTKDRLAWSDPEVRSHDQAIVDKWLKKAQYIGFYDYNYGTPYVLPRIYNHLMADNYRYAIDHNVIASYGELFPNWGEAPKIWLMTKLLWDPKQDVDALLDDWYKRAVGPEAAPYLKAYYDHWENFWQNRIKETDWFQGRKNIVYFMYNSAAYLSAVTDEEIAQSRSWLETAVEKAQTDQQKARAKLLLKAFEYYEASALSYPKAVGPLKDANSALDLLAKSIDFEPKMAYAKKRLELVEQFKNDILLKHQWDPRSESTLLWSGLNANAFWRLADYIKSHEANGGPVRQRVNELTAADQPEMARNYAQLLLRAVDEGPINLNSSFEEAGDPANTKVTAKYWDANIVNFGKFERKEFPANSNEVNSGKASIFVKNFYYGDINQTVDAKTGLIISRLKYYVTEDTRTVGDIWIELNLLDENGQKLSTIKSDRQPFYLSLGRWENIQIMDKIPARVNGVPVKKVQMAAVVNGFFEGGTMYIDDYELYQANEAFELPLLSSAQAAEGSIDIVFNKAPGQVPTAADFKVRQMNGGETASVDATLVSWNASTLTARLSVPSIKGKPWAQSVSYNVSYLDTDSIFTNAVTIPRMEGYTTVSSDSSFELWNDVSGLPQKWWYSAEGITRSDTVKRTGQYGIVAQYRYPGGIVQDMEALEPGHYIAVFHYKTSAANGKLQWVITPKNGTESIAGIVSGPSQASASNGNWMTHSFEFDAAADYNGKAVTSTQLLILLTEFQPGDTIYIDDAEIIRVDEPSQKPSISSAHAAEGSIDIVFNHAPEQMPAAADFTIQQIGDDQAVTISPSLVSWDAISRTAKLSVPVIARQPWAQSATYTISYKTTGTISTNAVVIPRLEGYTTVNNDPSFELWDAATGLPQKWWYSAEGITRSDTVKRTGQYGMVAQYRYPGGIVQDMGALEPGHYMAVFHYQTTAANGKVQWVITPKNGTESIAGIVSDPSQASASNGKWMTHSFEFDAAADYNGKTVTATQLLILLSDFQNGDTIFFDDAEIIRMN
ncbi:hypothetical protein Back11_59630 [Paenibacillus baekrokdamisoli]|uniref:Uncharacterized protein n=1 Tax=Paenibacillus baekrokdamisoli TaxID=1712516 RepID=A0A3G9JKG6_9BACL|nr:DUF4838 domain-containing protein [Paenibacillus baekrokdamisoli]MBB3071345.1 hypothetical protein [Paenibacillus baekrokdamisoli]BBH24618.1 hypothetical protein Back11_59630 [Paenibacillus baekrokdamisoli]